VTQSIAGFQEKDSTQAAMLTLKGLRRVSMAFGKIADGGEESGSTELI
jgi:hypothetical protein